MEEHRRAATAKPSKQLTSREQRNIIVNAPTERVPLAQLDRASGYGPEGRGFESLMVRQRHRRSRCLFSFPRDSEPEADARFPPACLRMQNRCGKFAIPSLRSLRIPHGTRRHRQSRCLFSSREAASHQGSSAKNHYGFCGLVRCFFWGGGNI